MTMISMVIFTFVLTLITSSSQSCKSTYLNASQSMNPKTEQPGTSQDKDEAQGMKSRNREAAPEAKARDLSHYDKAGPYDVNILTGNEALTRAEIRDFLWQHWSNQKLGHLVATFHGKEGQISTISYYIEPDEKGVWHVAATTKGTYYDRLPSFDQVAPRKAYTRTREFKAYAIERVKMSADGAEKYGKLSKEEFYPPELYRLLLIVENQSVKQDI